MRTAERALTSLVLRHELRLAEASVRAGTAGMDASYPSLGLANACFDALTDLVADSALASHRRLLKLLTDRLERLVFAPAMSEAEAALEGPRVPFFERARRAAAERDEARAQQAELHAELGRSRGAQRELEAAARAHSEELERARVELAARGVELEALRMTGELDAARAHDSSAEARIAVELIEAELMRTLAQLGEARRESEALRASRESKDALRLAFSRLDASHAPLDEPIEHARGQLIVLRSIRIDEYTREVRQTLAQHATPALAGMASAAESDDEDDGGARSCARGGHTAASGARRALEQRLAQAKAGFVAELDNLAAELCAIQSHARELHGPPGSRPDARAQPSALGTPAEGRGEHGVALPNAPLWAALIARGARHAPLHPHALEPAELVRMIHELYESKWAHEVALGRARDAAAAAGGGGGGGGESVRATAAASRATARLTPLSRYMLHHLEALYGAEHVVRLLAHGLLSGADALAASVPQARLFRACVSAELPEGAWMHAFALGRRLRAARPSAAAGTAPRSPGTGPPRAHAARLETLGNTLAPPPHGSRAHAATAASAPAARPPVRVEQLMSASGMAALLRRSVYTQRAYTESGETAAALDTFAEQIAERCTRELRAHGRAPTIDDVCALIEGAIAASAPPSGTPAPARPPGAHDALVDGAPLLAPEPRTERMRRLLTWADERQTGRLALVRFRHLIATTVAPCCPPAEIVRAFKFAALLEPCLLYTSPSPRD